MATDLPVPFRHSAFADAAEIEMARAAALAQYLRRGGPPAALPPSIPLYANEQLYAHSPIRFAVFVGEATAYTRSWFAVGRAPLFATMLGVSMLRNGAKKRAAYRQSMPQWRDRGSSTAYLTNMRLTVLDQGAFDDCWFNDLHQCRVIDGGLELLPRSGPPKRLELPSAMYWWVMMSMLHSGTVPVIDVGERIAIAASAHRIDVGGVAQGWHADPWRQFTHRYFDGEEWTAHVSANGQQQVDPSW